MSTPFKLRSQGSSFKMMGSSPAKHWGKHPSKKDGHTRDDHNVLGVKKGETTYSKSEWLPGRFMCPGDSVFEGSENSPKEQWSGTDMEYMEGEKPETTYTHYPASAENPSTTSVNYPGGKTVEIKRNVGGGKEHESGIMEGTTSKTVTKPRLFGGKKVIEFKTITDKSGKQTTIKYVTKYNKSGKQVGETKRRAVKTKEKHITHKGKHQEHLSTMETEYKAGGATIYR